MTQTRTQKDADESVKKTEQKLSNIQVRLNHTDSVLEALQDQMKILIALNTPKAGILGPGEKEDQPLTVDTPTIENAAPAAVPIQPEAAKEKLVRHSLHSYPRIELPVFTGTNTWEWLRKCDEYFLLHQILDDQKVDYMELYLEEEADSWYQSTRLMSPQISWKEFCQELIACFADISEITGAEPGILLKKQRTAVIQVTKPPYKHNRTPGIPRTTDNSNRPINSDFVKKLKPEEYQYRVNNHLCFKCGEKFGLGHIRKYKNFNIMIMDNKEKMIKEMN
ncbi:OLC1v1028209C1 [Oldenlandia corymbosa var. corymbosa]|uniref:OLC1v1028209C1 n=1 Tax=Oldenlandia corymbosa var. corymbosa TaxID=529605 RepID=A0AAV1CBG8_OLDCO|nr:OLC1v1028209C1 [Oldenlandia corymbosa var. corymbosa]